MFSSKNDPKWHQHGIESTLSDVIQKQHERNVYTQLQQFNWTCYQNKLDYYVYFTYTPKTKESGLYFNNAYITKKQMCIQLIFLLVIHVKKICKSRSILTVKNWHDYPQRKKCSERKKLKSKEWVINFERHNHFIRIQDYINLLIKNKNQCILRKK